MQSGSLSQIPLGFSFFITTLYRTSVDSANGRPETASPIRKCMASISVGSIPHLYFCY